MASMFFAVAHCEVQMRPRTNFWRPSGMHGSNFLPGDYFIASPQSFFWDHVDNTNKHSARCFTGRNAATKSCINQNLPPSDRIFINNPCNAATQRCD